MATNFQKQTVKKLYKTGFFREFQIGKNWLICKHLNITLSIQKRPNKKGYILRIGRPFEYQRTGLTYESEYQKMGIINCVQFIDHIKPVVTDNPDFILTVAMDYIFPEI